MEMPPGAMQTAECMQTQFALSKAAAASTGIVAEQPTSSVAPASRSLLVTGSAKLFSASKMRSSWGGALSEDRDDAGHDVVASGRTQMRGRVRVDILKIPFT